MTVLCTISEVRATELAFAKAHPRTSLMLRAGRAIAARAQQMVSGTKTPSILVLAGPGNNGGDAWVAAAELQREAVNVVVLALGEPQCEDPAGLKGRDAFIRGDGKVVKSWPRDQRFDLVIDGLFGIGLSRAPTGLFADIISATNAAHSAGETHVLAIDIPSGLNADTGLAFTPCIEADATLTFIAGKPGLYTADGAEVAGAVSVDSLGTEMPLTALSVIDRDALLTLLPARKANSHKGTYGSVGIIGGAEGMSGAAVLAARAALHMGPGKVYLGLFDKDRPPYDVLHPEIMVRDARTLAKDDSLTAFAVGMGMGDSGAASLLTMLTSAPTMVIDADALNIISSNTSIRAVFEAKPSEKALEYLPFILTPHPGEAARLLGVTTREVEADRVLAARTLAARFSSVAVLKGAGSIVAHPDGRAAINPTGNHGMASGGMGDALSGMLAAFLAQGMTPWDAARLGAYLHGAAAELASEHGMGPRGLTASEVIFEARSLLNTDLQDHHHDQTEE